MGLVELPNPNFYQDAGGNVAVPGRSKQPYAWTRSWSELETPPALVWLCENRFSLGRIALALTDAPGRELDVCGLPSARRMREVAAPCEVRVTGPPAAPVFEILVTVLDRRGPIDSVVVEGLSDAGARQVVWAVDDSACGGRARRVQYGVAPEGFVERTQVAP